MSNGGQLDKDESISHRLDMSLFGAEASQEYKELRGVSRSSGSGSSGKHGLKGLGNARARESGGNPLIQIDGRQF